jgi:hypothetical protein
MVVRCHGDSCACTASLNGCVWAVSRAFLLHVLLDVEFHVKSCGRLLTGWWGGGGAQKTRNSLGAGARSAVYVRRANFVINTFFKFFSK